MIKAVIFDFDDTLVHTYENITDTLRVFSKREGLHFPPETLLRKHWGKTWKEFFTAVWPGIESGVLRKFSRLSRFKPLPAVRGAHEVLDVLSKKYVIGIVTGRDRDSLMHRLFHSGIDFKKFSFIIAQDEIQKSKSHPAYFLPALSELEKLGIGKEEILFVGDSVYDYEIAQNAGLSFVGVLTGPNTREEFLGKGVKEQMILPSVLELPHFIENNGF